MPKTVFFLLCCLFSFQLLAQQTPQITQKNNSRIETYFYHQTNYDSFRLHIKGKNDTFLQENFYRNGRLQKQVFGKKDSIFEFDIAGFPYKKTFGASIDSIIEEYPNQNFCKKKFYHLSKHENNKMDSFFLTQYGQTHTFGREAGEGYILARNYYNRKNIFLKYKHIGNNDYYVQTFYMGKKVTASIINTHYKDRFEAANRYIDTVFCSDSRAYWVVKSDTNGIFYNVFIDRDGKHIEIKRKDLYVFKDNILCAYGIKTKKGDTLISPRFDNVDILGDYHCALWEGDKWYLMQPDGNIVKNFSAKKILPTHYKNDNQENPIYEDIENDLKFFFNFDTRFFIPRQLFRLPMSEAAMRVVVDKWENMKIPFETDQERGLVNGLGKVVFSTQKEVVFEHINDTLRLVSLMPITKSLRPKLPQKGIAVVKINGEVIPLDTSKFFQHLHNDLLTFKENKKIGLATANGEVMLKPLYHSIATYNDTLFKVMIDSNQLRIFNVKTREWKPDTFLLPSALPESPFFYRTNLKINYIYTSANNNLQGVIDDKWNTVIPPQYPAIEYGRGNNYIVKNKDNTFQFLKLGDIKPRPTYEKLQLILQLQLILGGVNKQLTLGNDDLTLFYAQKNGKWGVVNAQDQIIKPFIYDYATVTEGLLIANNKVFSAYPDSFLDNTTQLFGANKENKWHLINLIDSVYNTIFIDNNYNIVVPPHRIIGGTNQYRTTIQNYAYIVENQKGIRSLVLAREGKIVPYPFDHYLVEVPENSKIALVCNHADFLPYNGYQKPNSYIGVVALGGRVLAPCNGFWASIADPQTGLYFLKPDVERTYEAVKQHELCEIDSNWFLYDFRGKPLNTIPFRYPFSFHYGLGIGMQGNYFGVFDTTGKAIVPPQYQNIFRDKDNHFIYIVENKGLSSFTSLRNPYGKEIVPIGKYHAISPFYGKYALVKDGEKIGLIDTLGKEIVAPTDLMNLQTANLMDSLNLVNQPLMQQRDMLRKKAEISEDEIEKGFIHRQLDSIFYQLKNHFTDTDNLKNSEDSLKVLIDVNVLMRNLFWNIILHLKQDFYFNTNYNITIRRSPWHSGNFIKFEHSTHDYTPSGLSSIFIQKNSISFCTYGIPYKYFNYICENKVWKHIIFSDILNINGIKRQEINALLMQKIKALKGVDLDCTEGSDFVKQVLDKFLLTKNGIDFYFPQKHTHINNIRYDTPITCTWDELSPFLKMRF